MNTKVFAFLLIVPLGFFAADRLSTSPTDGGGKEKKNHKSTEKVEAKTAAPIEGETVEILETDPMAMEKVQELLVSKDKSPSKTLSKEQEAFKTSVEALQESYNELRGSDDIVWLSDSRVTEQEQTWLEKHVSQALDKANPIGMNLERSFSRCPSGYHIVLVSSSGTLMHEGWMIADDGCWDRPLGKFKYDIAAGTVQAMLGDQAVALQDYLLMLKAVYA